MVPLGCRVRTASFLAFTRFGIERKSDGRLLLKSTRRFCRWFRFVGRGFRRGFGSASTVEFVYLVALGKSIEGCTLDGLR